MRGYRLLGLVIASWALLLLAGCGLLPQPSAQGEGDVAATEERATPTQTATAHDRSWEASTVIAELYTSPGFTTDAYAWAVLPDRVLYSDGRLFSYEIDHTSENYESRLTIGQLDRAQICLFLRDLEADGFFDLVASDYPPLETMITDNGITKMVARGWRTDIYKLYALPALPFMIEEGFLDEDAVPAGFYDSYERFLALHATDAQPYLPETAFLYIREWTPTDDEWQYEESIPAWTVDQSVESLVNNSQEGQVRVDGKLAQQIFAELGVNGVWDVEEDGRYYMIGVRPLLPHETFTLPRSGWGNEPIYESSSTPFDCSADQSAIPPYATATPIVYDDEEPSVEAPPAPPAEDPFELIETIGERNQAEQLDQPTGIAVTAQNEVVISDAPNGRLHWYSADGSYLRAIALPEGTSAFDIAIGREGNLYIASWRTGILVLAPDGTLLQTFDDWPPADGPTDFGPGYPLPDRIAFGPDGRIYAIEALGGNRVVILNADGGVDEVWEGPDDGGFSDILTDVAVDNEGTLYVSDRGNDLLVVRRADGTVSTKALDRVFALLIGADGALYISRENRLERYRPDGDGGNEVVSTFDFFGVDDITFAPDGTLWALDNYAMRDGVVMHYDLATMESGPIRTFGDASLRPGQFETHTDFSVSEGGSLWYIELMRENIFAETPSQITHIDPAGTVTTFDSLGGRPFDCDRYLIEAWQNGVIVAEPCGLTVTVLDSENQPLVSVETGAAQVAAITDIVLAPDGETLYLLDGERGTLSRWSLSGELQGSWSDETQLRRANALGLSADGRLFIVNGREGRLIRFDPDAGFGELFALPDEIRSVYSLAVSADGTRFYIGDRESYLHVLDNEGNYRGARPLSGSNDIIVQTLSDGTIYASARSGEIYRLQDVLP